MSALKILTALLIVLSIMLQCHASSKKTSPPESYKNPPQKKSHKSEKQHAKEEEKAVPYHVLREKHGGPGYIWTTPTPIDG